MSLKLNPDPTFTAPVNIPTPSGDVQIRVVFKYRDRTAFGDFMTFVVQCKTDTEVMMELMEGWHDVDTPFSQAAVELLMKNYHASAKAIMSTYIQELTQQKMGN